MTRHLDAAQLSSFLRNLDEAVVAVDDAGRITFASPYLRDLTGHDPAAVVGQALAEVLVVDGDRSVVHRVGGGSWPVEVATTAGDDVAPVGDAVHTVRRRGGAADLEAELRRRLEAEERMTRLATSFMGLGAAAFDEGVHAALAVVGGSVGVAPVGVWQTTGQAVERTYVWPAAIGAGASRSLPLVGAELVARLRSLDEVVIADVAALDERWGLERRLLQRWGVGSLVAVPLVVDGRADGWVSVESSAPGVALDAGQLAVLRSCAGILAEAFVRRDTELELERQARTDELTGLANRWSFLDLLDVAIAAGERRSAVLVIDVDRMEAVNDRVGHPGGDIVLRTMAERFTGTLAGRGVVGRLGGDELVALVHGVRDERAAVGLARELQMAAAAPIEVGRRELAVTVSIGVVLLDGTRSAVELLGDADAAMYEAKLGGRNRLRVHDHEMTTRSAAQRRRELELRQVVARDELELHHQPELDSTGELAAIEALVRWRHPDLGLLRAAEFMLAAEETGASIDVGDWVFEQLARDVAVWHAAGAQVPTVRVNVSTRQLHQPGLVARVLALRERSDHAAFGVELSETTLMLDPDRVLAVAGTLRAEGIEVVVDGFGIAASSLAYLGRLAPDVVKLHRSFAAALDHEGPEVAVVEATVRLGQRLGFEVVVVGVEARPQLDLVRSLGCRAQGDLFARPQAAAALLAEGGCLAGRPR